MIKILILAANPRDDLDLNEEIRDLKDVINDSRNRQDFEVEDALAVRSGDLQELLFQHEPHIVHFCGHGGGEAGLVFEGKNGREQWVRTEALRDLFRLFSNKVGCVLLNACYSEEQAEEIVNHIDYVIGMNQAIRDDAAIAFAKGFYRALGYNCSIEEAYEFGCNAIQLELAHGPDHPEVRSVRDRKLNAVNNHPAVVALPEHQKPILRKRPNATGSRWRKSATPPLPPAQRAQLKEEVARAVTGFPRPASPESPPTNSPTPRSSLPAPPTHQTLPNQRLIAILLGAAACLMGAIGVLGYHQWQKRPIPPDHITSNMAAPVRSSDSKSDIAPLDNDPAQAAENTLQQVGKLANKKQCQSAVMLLREIAPDHPVTQKQDFQFYLTTCSEQLLSRAKDLYKNGNQIGDIDQALDDAQIIPANSAIYPKAQGEIIAWQQEKKLFNILIKGLNDKWDLLTANQRLGEIQNPSLRNQLLETMGIIEPKIARSAIQSLKKKSDIEGAKRALGHLTNPGLRAELETAIKAVEAATVTPPQKPAVTEQKSAPTVMPQTTITPEVPAKQ